MLYIPALEFIGATGAKLIHFSFGIGCIFLIYKFARKFTNKKLSLLACLIFYSNLVVAWLSITSYIDLGRAFFETLALYLFVDYLKKGKSKYLVKSAIIFGIAIASKILSILSLIVFIPVLFLVEKRFGKCIVYVAISLLVASPWLIFSYLSTGSPIYPFLSVVTAPISVSSLNLIGFIHSPDPISCIYLIFLPLIAICFRKFSNIEKTLVIYGFFSLIPWIFFETASTGRFLSAYLPLYSVICVCSLKYIKNKRLEDLLIVIVIFISLTTILYRSIANFKYIPVIIGTESKSHFLSNNLNFSFGDFYDVDGYFQKHIKSSDKVLVYNIHNLFYTDFPFVESSYMKRGEHYDYVLVRGSLPKGFEGWKKVYSNEQTMVNLYKKTK